MALDLVARAETGEPWRVLSARLAAALGPAWRAGPARAGGARAHGVIDVGPPVDPVVVTCREGLVQARARTSPWGPGYHERVVERLDRAAAALPRGWSHVQDDTDHWERRCPAALRRHFLRWAHALWALDQPGEPGAGPRVALDGVAVCLRRGEGPAEVPPGHVATPTGFKGRSWIEETRAALRGALVAGAGEPGPRARRAFVWWATEPDAFDWAQLGRVLCTTEVIWRALPSGDDPAQVEAREAAVACFEAARRLDPAADVPLPEWARLYELLGRPTDAGRVRAEPAPGAGSERDAGRRGGPELPPPGGAADAAREAPSPPPSGPFRGGYREGWVRHPLGRRWHAEVPGWLRASLDAAHGHEVLWDDELTVHVTVVDGGAPGPAFEPAREVDRLLERLPPEERAGAQVELLGNGGARGYAVVIPSGRAGRDALVHGLLVGARSRLGFTAVARSRAARQLALRFGRSLRPAPES